MNCAGSHPAQAQGRADDRFVEPDILDLVSNRTPPAPHGPEAVFSDMDSLDWHLIPVVWEPRM